MFIYLARITSYWNRLEPYREKKGPSPDWVVGRAEIDEEIPRPVSHLEEVAHGAQVHGQ